MSTLLLAESNHVKLEFFLSSFPIFASLIINIFIYTTVHHHLDRRYTIEITCLLKDMWLKYYG
jgi:hypothetical protein